MDDFLVSDAKISIVGLGLIGGSAAMALRNQCAKLYGCDIDPATIEYAEQKRIFDQVTQKPEEILSKSDVIILAMPVDTIVQYIAKLPDLCAGEAIVMDMGSTKREIVHAFGNLPERFAPIGGHPMSGKESLSIMNASADIFEGATFALTPLSRTTGRARQFALQLVEVLGANPLWIDAERHDAWAAAISHLPYLVSLALALSTPEESAELAGSGFKSSVRLAGTPASMMLDIVRANRDNLLHSGAGFVEKFTELLELVEREDFNQLVEEMKMGKEKKEAFTTKGKK